HRSQIPGREHHHRPRRTLHTIVHLLHPTHTRHHIPSLDQDPVPGILQLPGHPLRPHPIHLGIRDKEVTPRPRDTTIHHRPRISRKPRERGGTERARPAGGAYVFLASVLVPATRAAADVRRAARPTTAWASPSTTMTMSWCSRGLVPVHPHIRPAWMTVW